MKGTVFWDITPCGSYKIRCFGGTYRLHFHGKRIILAGKLRGVRRLSRYVCPKRLFLKELHSVVISQKTDPSFVSMKGIH
jgi:hypothetical protein